MKHRGIQQVVDSVPTASFSIVMATGIVSIAALSLELNLVAGALLGVNVALDAALWAILIARIAMSPRAIVLECQNPNAAFGQLTIVAANSVLGLQLLTICDSPAAALVLWWLSAGMWAALVCVVSDTVAKNFNRSTIKRLDGSWLLAVVATQSVSGLAASLAPNFTDWTRTALWLSLVFWLTGIALYSLIIGLVIYRLTFAAVTPEDLGPSYWIGLGAMAISTLAGTSLTSSAESAAMLPLIVPWLKGATLACWGVASCWIPLLAWFGIWRHCVKRYPLVYEFSYWSLVFPLGMYSACTFQLARMLELPALLPIASGLGYLAMAAWAITFGGFAVALYREADF